MTLEESKKSEIRVIFPEIGFRKENPYLDLLASHLSKNGFEIVWATGLAQMARLACQKRDSVIHLQWLEMYLGRDRWRDAIRPFWIALVLNIVRLFGVKIIWTIHNLEPHEDRRQSRYLKVAQLVAQASHYVIVHCDAAAELVRERFGLSPDKIRVVPHGNYISSYPNVLDRKESRGRLGISESDKVGLFLGTIRRYKGVERLVKAFESNCTAPNAKLILAGKLVRMEGEWLEAIAKDCPRILIREGFVLDEEIQLYMNAADFVVFPYDKGLTSGALVLAMSFGKACLAPRIGCFNSILTENGAFLYCPTKDFALEESLATAYHSSDEQLEQMGRDNLTVATSTSWELVADKTAKCYQSALDT